MARHYTTPGVYVEEITKFPPSIAQVATAIPAFIGYTEKARLKSDGDLNLAPWRIRSLLEFEQYFGEADKEREIKVTITEGVGHAPDEVVAEVGNRRRYQMYYALQLYFANGGGPCYITSVGTYEKSDTIDAGRLKKGLEAVAREDEVTLIVFPEGQNLATAAEYYDLQRAALAQCADRQDRFAVMDLWLANDPSVDDVEAFREGIGTENLRNGAAYYPNLETVLNFHYDPDVVCVEGAFTGTLTELETADHAWFSQALAKIEQLPNVLPPSPAVVGIYAAVDESRGVWKAPANVSLNAVVKPALRISDDDQASLNVDARTGKSINAIRAFVGKGTLIWGARTLAGNDSEWRYVSVRRFFNMVEESIRYATKPFVFEPNDGSTWVKVKAMIENFLTLQWSAGALFGSTPSQAFYVSVGLGETMTPQDVLEGRMIVEIGMAAVRPAEFIILRFSQQMPEA